MSGAALFVLATAAGAAALALWLEVRLPGLAPAGVGRRLAALVVACVLLQVAAAAFPALLALPAAEPLRELAALAVLLLALVFAFLAAAWLLRSLAALGGVR